MTHTFDATTKPPLNVGSIIADSFRIFGSQFLKVLAIGFLASFIEFLVNGAFLGFSVALGGQPDVTDTAGYVGGVLLSTLVSLMFYGLSVGLLVQLAYDAKRDRTQGLPAYFGPALRAAIPIAVLSIVVGILAGIGAIALLIGGLWVMAVFYIISPVAVIERAGFGALGRSAQLTKEYRWPIVGLFILISILWAVIGGVIGGVVGAIGFSVGFGTTYGVTDVIAAGVLTSLLNGIAYGFGGITVALVYARLREIKEGISVDEIAAVFD